MRGRSSTEVFDLGALVPEIAAVEGVRAFSLLVLPGAGSDIAAYDPANYKVGRTKSDEAFYRRGLQPLYAQAEPSGFTLFETAPLRPLLGYSRTPADPELQRMVHGFDAILVMTGSTPSISI